MEHAEEDIITKEEYLNNIKYADKAVVFANSLEGLQQLMTRITEAS